MVELQVGHGVMSLVLCSVLDTVLNAERGAVGSVLRNILWLMS